MKLLLTTLTLGVALCLANAPRAALPAADGGLTPPPDNRCSLSAGAPVVDYGVQSRWQLQDTGGPQRVTPGKRSLQLNVVCPYSQSMRLTLRGERAGNGELRYGERGSVALRLLDAQLDGQGVQLAATTSDGVLSGGGQDSLQLLPGNGFAAVQNGRLLKGKSFTARIELEPVMPESAARVSARQVSEANLTLELMD
ncbi:fimbrial protein [Serratia marcescens]|uniref:fimbrial protein n=1 Tax=Serratia marcescens TaxID=615 RepID=UPI000F7E4376|nr:fimbrial protein [Serratia marcescens]RTF43319.1 fimbrial protein [Serratia marcescens]